MTGNRKKERGKGKKMGKKEMIIRTGKRKGK